MNSARLTVLMAATKDYAFALGNVLIGLEKWSPGLADRVVIFHDGLSDTDIGCLLAIRPCEFRFYAPPLPDSLVLRGAARRFSMMMFARYEMFDLLETSEFVLYLDADVVILRDISGILAYRPVGMKRGGFPLNTSLGPNEFGLPDSVPGHNTGVIIAHNAIPSRGLREECYDLTARLWDTLRFPDQGVLNYVLYRNGIAVTPFPKSYNAHLNEFVPDKHILHQPTGAKYWNHGVVNLLSPEWEAHDREWKKLGGTPFAKSGSKWEFASFRNTPLNNIMLMANVYQDVVERFLQKLRDRLATLGVASEIEGFALVVQSRREHDIRLWVRVWGLEAVAELRVADRAAFEALRALIHDADGVSCRVRSGDYAIVKREAVDVDFLQSASGVTWCVASLRQLARLARKIRR